MTGHLKNKTWDERLEKQGLCNLELLGDDVGRLPLEQGCQYLSTESSD